MTKTVLLSNGIETKVKRSRRAKRLRITIQSDGGVVLTIPFFVSFEQGRSFLESKADWIKEKWDIFAKNPPHFLRKGDAREFETYKEKARELILERLEYFERFYQLSFKKVSVRNQKTRWGSCSVRGNLSFTYRLLFLPEHLRDYVIVHELCHLKEMNHSSRFWALVSRTFPHYQRLREELNLFAESGKSPQY